MGRNTMTQPDTRYSKDYECTACGRKQSKVGRVSKILITQRDIETIGWKKHGKHYLCPFCSGNEQKLQQFFNHSIKAPSKPRRRP